MKNESTNLIPESLVFLVEIVSYFWIPELCGSNSVFYKKIFLEYKTLKNYFLNANNIM